MFLNINSLFDYIIKNDNPIISAYILFFMHESYSSDVIAPSSTVLLDPTERAKRFGIEVKGPAGDGVAFLAGQWTPGGEV